MHPQIQQWLDHRARLREAARAAGEFAGDDDFLFAVMFFLLMYVDDQAQAVISDLLYDRSGRPVIVMLTDRSGVVRRVHQRRAALYYEAVIGIAAEIGYKAPLDKRVYPASMNEFHLPEACAALEVLVFLGNGIDRQNKSMYLSQRKEKKYTDHVVEVFEAPCLPNGLPRFPRASFESLVHRLMHASPVIPLGRAHLFHCLAALRDVNRMDHVSTVAMQQRPRRGT